MRNLWRPFSVPGSSVMLQLEKGNGTHVTDAGGREYLDAAGGLWNVSLGLNNARLVEQVHAQLKSLTYAPLFHATNPPAERLADKLITMSGGTMQHVYLSTTGSTAVELALRVSRLHHRAKERPAKKRVLSFDLGYHGCSGMGLSASGILADEVGKYEEILPGFQTIPSPMDEAASLAALSTMLMVEADQIAALIMEPVIGSGGIIVPGKAYCEEISRLCAQHDVLLVADEVATGGGRCGAMFASSLLNLKPDIITLSKGINSGYFPLGATLFSDQVVKPIAARNMRLQYGSTQDGNPVGCVSALATLECIEENGLMHRAGELGAWIKEQLSGNSETGVVKEVRGLGLMIGIELAHLDPQRTPFNPEESSLVRHLCQDAGLLVYHFDRGLSLFPALTLSQDDAACMVDILREVLVTLC